MDGRKIKVDQTFYLKITDENSKKNIEKYKSEDKRRRQ
jgi:hypothetical protein